MIVDLNNTTEYDKQIICLDSNDGTYNTTNIFDFYINFENPIKNISSVKIIDAEIILKSKTLNYDDVFYIELNDYHRVLRYIKSKDATFKYFDSIPFDKGYYKTTDDFNKFKIFYSLSSSNWTDPTLHILNPIEHNVRRFNIKIKDKNLNILNKLDGETFKITICAYTIKKNIYG